MLTNTNHTVSGRLRVLKTLKEPYKRCFVKVVVTRAGRLYESGRKGSFDCMKYEFSEWSILQKNTHICIIISSSDTLQI